MAIRLFVIHFVIHFVIYFVIHFVILFSDKKLEDSFQKSMDAGMLRYIQPKGANEIKVSFQACKNMLYTDFGVPSSPFAMIYSKL